MSNNAIIAIIAVLILIIANATFVYWNQQRNVKYKQINFGEIKNNLIERQTVDKSTEMLFNRANNPWGMSIRMFKLIRQLGAIVGITAILIGGWLFGLPYGVMPGAAIFGLSWIYPVYFYKASGEDREFEWNKMYEYIWCLKDNLRLYDARQAYIKTRDYIQENAPENKELIQGFTDFAETYSPDGISKEILNKYSFAIPKQIIQITYNSQSRGESADRQLDQLRQFILNIQDKAVVKKLSSLSSMATISSLPFMMISMIVALMVPMIMQFVQFM